MAFIDDLESVGFSYQSAGRGGVKHYVLRGNRFLTYYCHVAHDDSRADFAWEFALGEFCESRGLAVGANDVLNIFLFPQREVAVAPSVAAVVAEIDAAETLLNSLRLADPGI
ncbi:MAG: hypothetical protein ABR520_03785 [Mycobacteriales bacterium]|nr:hypothetical protein [Frankia sp.]